MSVSSYLFHSLPFKLLNKRMNFPFPLLKLPNKRREKYSKSILFIHLYSIRFPSSKWGLRPCHQFSKINVFYFLREASRKQRAKRSYDSNSWVHEGFFSLFNIIHFTLFISDNYTLFLKNTYSYQTFNYVFSVLKNVIKTCYQTHFFFSLWVLKRCVFSILF